MPTKLPTLWRSVCLAAALLVPAGAFAADVPFDDVPQDIEAPEAVEARDIIIDLGLGVALQPEFPTARDYEAVPFPLVRLRFLRLPFFGEVMTGEERAFSIYPSFNIVGERNEDDAFYLEGTGDVDTAVELGAGAAVRFGQIRGFVEARYGVTGHDGIIAEAGVDAIIDQFERFELRLGPRVSFASDEYMDTYFGVGPGTPFLADFDPEGGFKDVGIEAEASYALTQNLWLHGRAGVTQFVGDAADSPITEAGNDLEGTVGIGLTYRFGLDLY